MNLGKMAWERKVKAELDKYLRVENKEKESKKRTA